LSNPTHLLPDIWHPRETVVTSKHEPPCAEDMIMIPLYDLEMGSWGAIIRTKNSRSTPNYRPNHIMVSAHLNSLAEHGWAWPIIQIEYPKVHRKLSIMPWGSL